MRKDIKILNQEEIGQKLKSLPGWEQKDDKILKEFKFDDFVKAINFIIKLMPFCEKMDHHPDIHIFYNRVLFELQRYDVGGKITDMDFRVAQEIERLYSRKIG